MTPSKLTLLRHAMRTYAWRADALAGNLANLDTPGYQRLGVTFEETLQEARRGFNQGNTTEAVEPKAEVADGPPLLEDELMELADTQMRTQLTARALREHFTLMRMGITGRAS